MALLRIEDAGLVYYQFAALRAVPGLRHGLFTRLGGTSQPPFASLNVGGSVGDASQAVAENTRRCLAALGFEAAQVVTPHQVHGEVVARVGIAEAGRVIPATDGLLTDERGIVLLLRFADCVPIMLYDDEHAALALVHAGWRGTLAGIAARAVAQMQAHFGTRPARLWAGIGPAIGPCCYEVGSDLRDAFERRFGPRAVAGRQDRPARVDLSQANAMVLGEAGVPQVEVAGLCTACHTGEFFSHRAEGGRTGRQAALIGLAEG
ncbi:MAG: peptidoglycan editing factor PgeF [Anaerolineae bacterium]|nr:peptidoglycan editing factor PgeF [Anaerolineae bacterium]